MKLIKRLKRKYKLWKMSKQIGFGPQMLFAKKIICRYKAWKTNQKHYLLFDYRGRVVIVNTLMLEKFKKNRLLNRNWSKDILYESK